MVNKFLLDLEYRGYQYSMLTKLDIFFHLAILVTYASVKCNYTSHLHYVFICTNWEHVSIYLAPTQGYVHPHVFAGVTSYLALHVKQAGFASMAAAHDVREVVSGEQKRNVQALDNWQPLKFR